MSESSATEWLELVRSKSDKIESVLGCLGGNFEITAPAAERACEVIRELHKDEELSMERFNRLLKEGDAGNVLNFLNSLWFQLPESSAVRSVPGFFDLCDLCEGW